MMRDVLLLVPLASAPDVMVVGAGVVGAACALAARGRACGSPSSSVGRSPSGTTGAGEGNILVSDKEPGPELELALLSRAAWRELAGTSGR